LFWRWRQPFPLAPSLICHVLWHHVTEYSIFARPEWYDDCKLGKPNCSLCMQFHEQPTSPLCLRAWSCYFRKTHKLQVYCNVKNFNRKYLALKEVN
jgi:hypothetical protein